MKIRSKVRAGGKTDQHNARKLVVKSGVKAGKRGGWDANHNARRA